MPCIYRHAHQVEVDEPEALTGLDEKADDEVIDGTASTDALHAVTIDRFDSDKLALEPALLKGLQRLPKGFQKVSKRPSRRLQEAFRRP